METTLKPSLTEVKLLPKPLHIVAQEDPLERWRPLHFWKWIPVAEALWGLPFQVRGAQLRKLLLIFLEGAKGVRSWG